MAKKKASTTLLRLSRIDFYRLRGDEFFRALFDTIENELGEGPARDKRWAKLNRTQQGMYAWWCFCGDVLNGGLVQYFYNHTDASVPAMAELLKVAGNPSLAKLVQQATKIYRKHKQEFAVETTFGEDGLFARMTELGKLDEPVERQLDRTSKMLEKWLRANISKLAVADDGEPIDPRFSGQIETHHPNGKVFEQATVRRGVLSGTYRRYFDDGVVEHECFYDGVKVSTSNWPSGQPKRKKIKHGKLTIHEWYYPSGKLQKRFVASASGKPEEPVRLWHENGQLAEEVHVKAGEECGPWLRFFEDGSPRLVAENRLGEVPVIKNAWDDERRQVVKNGRGTYLDDGLSIVVSYQLVFEGAFRHLQELRDGISHGHCTTWFHGVLWSKAKYAKGKLHGTNTTFYDNGRVCWRSHYRHGKEVKSETFPKFKNPRPAVQIKVESNADLHAAWGHPLLDVYPAPVNLDQLQREIKIPAFLADVHERNRLGTLKDQYDDVNTFDDGSTYAVQVNAAGTVERVDWSGCSPYSVVTVNDYPPVIRKLKFQPGRLRGQPVACQVIVRVHHTFADGNA